MTGENEEMMVACGVICAPISCHWILKLIVTLFVDYIVTCDETATI